MNQNNATIYNIDSLSLNLPFNNQIFESYKVIPTDCIDYREGYEIAVIDKNDEEEPSILYLYASFDNGNPIGLFILDRNKESMRFYIHKKLFYEQLTGMKVGNGYVKVNMLGCLDFMWQDLNIDAEKISVDKLTIVRDCYNDSVLKLVAKYHANSEYETIINGKVQDKETVLIEKYDFSSTVCNTFPKVNKHTDIEALALSNINGSLSLLAYNKSKEINVSHEHYIVDFDEVPEGKQLYRTQISLTGNHLNRYFEENGIKNSGWFSFSDLYPSKLEPLFNYLAHRMLHFRNINTRQIINI